MRRKIYSFHSPSGILRESLFQWFMMCDCVHVLVSAVLLRLASIPEVIRELLRVYRNVKHYY